MRRRCDDVVDRRDIGGIVDRAGIVDREIARDLVEQLRRVGLQRVLRIDQRRQFLVFDRDQFGGIERLGQAVGDHHRDGLADMHDLALGEAGPVRERDLGAAAAWDRRMPRHAADAFEIGGGQDADHARRLQRLIERDRHDAGMGIGRAHERDMRDALLLDIVDELAASADEGVVLDAGAVGMGIGCHGVMRSCLRSSCPALCRASTFSIKP